MSLMSTKNALKPTRICEHLLRRVGHTDLPATESSNALGNAEENLAELKDKNLVIRFIQ